MSLRTSTKLLRAATTIMLLSRALALVLTEKESNENFASHEATEIAFRGYVLQVLGRFLLLEQPICINEDYVFWRGTF